MDTNKRTIFAKQTIDDAEYSGKLLELRELLPHTVVVNLASHDVHADPVQDAIDAATYGGRVVVEQRSTPSPTERWDRAELESRVARLHAIWPDTPPTIVPAILSQADLLDFDGLKVTASAQIAGRPYWNSRDVGCETFGELRTELAGEFESAGEGAWALGVVDYARNDQTMLTLRRCGVQIDTPRFRLRVAIDGPHDLMRPEGGRIVALAGCHFHLCDQRDGTTTVRRMNGPMWNTLPSRIDTSAADDATALHEVLWELLDAEVLR